MLVVLGLIGAEKELKQVGQETRLVERVLETVFGKVVEQDEVLVSLE